MNSFSKLAVAQALSKAVDAAVKTGKGDNLRAECDRQALSNWEAMGFADVAAQSPLMVEDIRVGNLTCHRELQPWVVDEELWKGYQAEHGWVREQRPTIRLDWLTDEQFDRVVRLVHSMDASSCVVPSEPKWLGADKVVANEDGTVTNEADGDVVPGVIARYDYSTRISGCKPADVAAAIGASGIDAGSMFAELVAPVVGRRIEDGAS